MSISLSNTPESNTCDKSSEFEVAALSLLKSRGYRITRQRRLIVGRIARIKGIFATTDVYESTQNDEPESIDQVTVYRILGVLLENGLVHKIPGSQSYSICTHTTCGHLLHLLYTCPTCSNSQEARLPKDLSLAMHQFLQANDRQVKTAVLQVVGSCSECQYS